MAKPHKIVKDYGKPRKYLSDMRRVIAKRARRKESKRA